MSVSSHKESISEGLLLEDSSKGGVIVAGIADNSVAKKSGLKQGDEIVAATIHLDHLSKQDVLKILKVLEPYDDNMKVLTKQELNANISSGFLAGGLKGPSEMLTASYSQKNEVSRNASAEAPVLTHDGIDGQLKADSGLGGEINGPKLNGGLPNITLKKPSANLDGNLKGSSPTLSSNDASVQINQPNVKTELLHFQPQQFQMPEFNLAQMDTKAVDIEAPGVSRHMADVNLSAPNVGMKGSDLDLSGENLSFNAPKTEAELNPPDVDISKTGKVNWPHLKWNKSKSNKPKTDIDANRSLECKTPKFEGDMKGPDVDLNLSKASPECPDIDVESPSGKINWPHLKWKKSKGSGSSFDMDMDANVKTPDLDIKAPQFEGKCELPKGELEVPDVKSPNIDAESPSGKMNWPHKKWKKSKLNVTNNDVDIDADMKTPDLYLSAPECNINGQGADFPTANVSAPDVDIKAPAVKSKLPNAKKPKWTISGNKKTPKGDLNATMATPALSTPTTKIDGKIHAPAELKCPESDINVPDVHVDQPSGKFKFPTLKKPKIGTLKSPKISADADANIKVPGIDLNSPDVELIKPELKHSTPKLEGSIDTPDIDINMPKANISVSPDVDLKAPDAKVKGKMPKLNLSKRKGPKVKVPDVDASLKCPKTELQPPDLALSTPTLKGHIDAPNCNVNLPNADLKSPELDMHGPEIEAPSGKFKFPKFGWTGQKGKATNLDMKATEIDGVLPKVGVAGPGVQLPNIEGGHHAVDLNLPKLDSDLKQKTSGFNLSAPRPALDINLPKAEIQGQQLELQSPDVNTSGKKKTPTIKIPKFSLSKPKVESPDLNVNTDLKSPKTDFSVPDIDVNVPHLDINRHDPVLNTPKPSTPNITGSGLDINLPKTPDTSKEMSSPNFKVPTLNWSKPKVGGTDLDVKADLEVADLDASGKVKSNEIQLKAPTVEEAPLGEFKMPHFKLPKFGLSSPKGEGHGLDITTPDGSVSVPSAEPDIQIPKVNADASAANLKSTKTSVNVAGDDEAKDSTKGTLRWPFKFRSAGNVGSEDEASGADSEPALSDEEVEVPVFKLHRLPKNSIDGSGESDALIEAQKISKGLKTEEKDYVISKGIRLPILTANTGGKVDIAERLKRAMEKKVIAPSPAVAPQNQDMIRGGTFKVVKPDTETDLEHPVVASSDKNDKLSVSLSNMLGLDTNDPDTE